MATAISIAFTKAISIAEQQSQSLQRVQSILLKRCQSPDSNLSRSVVRPLRETAIAIACIRSRRIVVQRYQSHQQHHWCDDGDLHTRSRCGPGLRLSLRGAAAWRNQSWISWSRSANCWFPCGARRHFSKLSPHKGCRWRRFWQPRSCSPARLPTSAQR